MFPGCHFSPEAFHFSFVLQEYHWHGLITKKLLTQKVMLLWTMVWEEMGKPIHESSYKLLRFRYIVINQQQFIRIFEEKPYKNSSCAV